MLLVSVSLQEGFWSFQGKLQHFGVCKSPHQLCWLTPLYVHCSGCSTEHLGTQHNLLTTAQFTMAMLAVFKMGPPGKLTVAEYPWKNPCQLMNASPGTTLFQQLSWLDLKECLRGKLTAMEAYMHA
jgi:hypothetical protein